MLLSGLGFFSGGGDLDRVMCDLFRQNDGVDSKRREELSVAYEHTAVTMSEALHGGSIHYGHLFSVLCCCDFHWDVGVAKKNRILYKGNWLMCRLSLKVIQSVYHL